MTGLLQEWVTLHAERAPGATAVVMDRETLTYEELDRLSNQVARILADGGCRRGDRVCLLSQKSPAAIAGILGIIKADCTFVPLDPQSPAARQRKVIESSECKWILANGNVAHLLDEILQTGAFRFPLSVGWLGAARIHGVAFRGEFSSIDFATYSTSPLEYQNRSSDPAHILFTSGSTG